MSEYYDLGNTCPGLTPLGSWGFWCVDLAYVPNIVGQILYLWAPDPYLHGAPFTAVYAGQDPSICIPAITWTESTQQVTAQHPGGGTSAPPGTDLQYWVADLLPWGTLGC